MLHDLILETAAPLVSITFVEELNHRVVNEFAEAVSTLSLAAARAPCQHARDSLDGAARRLLAHADLHRSLLQPSASGNINLADYLSGICASFSSALLADGGTRIHMRSEDVYLSAERCWRMGLIVAELVRNCLRHSLSAKAGVVLVEIRQRDEQVTCLVCDNGHSAPNASPGRGQRLVRFLASDLGGLADWTFTERGNIARVDVPIGAPEEAAQVG